MHIYFTSALPLLVALAYASPAAAQSKLDAAVELANGKAYFFRGNQAALYDLSREKVDPGQPQPLCTAFPGLPDSWCNTGIDSAMLGHGGGKVHFFKGREYLTFNLQRRAVEVPPRPISAGWQGVWPDGINVAVNAGNGSAYFFKGSQYVKFNFVSNGVENGYPKPIAGYWPGWPATWFSGIDAAFCRLNGKVYYFKGRDYIKYDVKADASDPGYPMAITDATWGGLPAFLDSAPTVAAQPPVATPGTTVVNIPGLGPIALPDLNGPLICARDYAIESSGGCTPTPVVRKCIEEYSDRVRQRNLATKPPSELTREEARDLIVQLYQEKHITPYVGFEPVFDRDKSRQCFVARPPQLATPDITINPGLTRYALAGTIDGVSFYYYAKGDKTGRFRYVEAAAPKPIINLEVRMVPALYKLVAYLKEKCVTRIYHTGITNAAGVHVETGFTIDFAGACGGKLGPCYGEPGVCKTAPDERKPGSPPCREPEGFFVMDDWGTQAVPVAKADPADPNQWRSTVKDPTFRLDLPTANPRARDFFRGLYDFFQLQYRTGGITPIGQPTAIMHPDSPTSDPGGKSGREGHRNHIHAELPGRKM